MSVSAYRGIILNLYRQQLRSAARFNTWNFREYFKEKAREEFKAIKNEKDVEKLKAFVEKVTHPHLLSHTLFTLSLPFHTRFSILKPS